MPTEHPDNGRFFLDVEQWIGRKITIIRSDKYATVDEVFEKRRYMSGSKGAPCTTEMKKFPRVAFQQPDDIHIFGYTAEEEKRAERFEDNNPELRVEWILIDQGVTKESCPGASGCSQDRAASDVRAGLRSQQLHRLRQERESRILEQDSTSVPRCICAPLSSIALARREVDPHPPTERRAVKTCTAALPGRITAGCRRARRRHRLRTCVSGPAVRGGGRGMTCANSQSNKNGQTCYGCQPDKHGKN